MGFPTFGGFCPTYGPKRKFRKRSQRSSRNYYLPHSTLLKGVDELEMYDYTRNDSNIRVYGDFERDREGGELYFFALNSVQNATSKIKFLPGRKKVKGDVLDDENE